MADKHTVDLEIICQKNQVQINKDNICKNSKRVYHDYKFVDKVMLNNNSDFKYEAPYKVPFYITHFWTIGAVTLQYGA